MDFERLKQYALPLGLTILFLMCAFPFGIYLDKMVYERNSENIFWTVYFAVLTLIFFLVFIREMEIWFW